MDFLEKVARKLYDEHHGDMENQIVVLPSRRAGLYLSRCLGRLSSTPQWAPQMVTVTELFQSFTGVKPAGAEILNFELYRIYAASVPEPMPFDDFWSWGEVIISDFNDIDLYMADAEKLYSNISDLKEIDDKFGDLTEEQIEIIRKFWISFNPRSSGSEARNRFRTVWMMLGPLYREFSNALVSKGYAGDGMLCRSVASRADNATLTVPGEFTWHIAGLNALNECEKLLFKYLKGKNQARFYWDDDHRFMDDPDHRAAFFIRENIGLFGNDLGISPTRKAEMDIDRWVITDTPSDTAQAKMLPDILREAGISENDDLTDTAVILADEKLLIPVLTSLPAEIGDVNVTMGHPFRFTPLYSFVRQLFILSRSARRSGQKTSFRTEDIISVLRHQYFRLLSGGEEEKVISAMIEGNMVRVDTDFLSGKLGNAELFRIPDGGAAFPAYLTGILGRLESGTYGAPVPKREMSIDREYIRMALGETRKLENLIGEYFLEMKTETCVRLIDRVFKRLIVPFSGEPLKGLQVMGVLETRALEFRKVIFLSMNEGIFPHQSYDNTFIPYNIRRAFGLPTINEHESIYSYHFFRLLRKPERGWFLYNSTAQGLNTGEMSRYLIQMKYEQSYSPEFRTMHITVGRSRIIPETLDREAGHMQSLLDRYAVIGGGDRVFSPSAINTWLNCRMKFYYKYVCGIPEEEKLDTDIDQRRFGNILHDVMRRLYEPLVGDANPAEKLRMTGSDGDLIQNTVRKAASAEMKWSEETILEGKGVIILDVLERYVRDVLRFDLKYENLSFCHLENRFARMVDVSTPSGNIRIQLGGVIDRVDISGGVMRVVDYKTGTPKNESVQVGDLFDETREKRSDAVLQTLLYCSVLSDYYRDVVINPAIYWVQQISSPDFNPSSYLSEFGTKAPDLKTWKEVMERFESGLAATLSRIFSPDEAFKMTEFNRRCTYCPFIRLCRR